MKHKLAILLFAALCGTANIYAQTQTIIPDKPEVIMKADTDKELEVRKEDMIKHPNDPSYLGALIEYYITHNQTNEALSILDKAIENDKKNPSFYFAKGVCFDKLGRQDDAILAYLKAIELKPDYGDAYYNLSAIYVNRGVAQFEVAKAVPTNEQARYETERNKADEQFKKTIPYLENAVKYNPTEASLKDQLKSLYSWLKMNIAQTPTIIPDKPEVILVSGGTFNMGSNNGMDDQKPVHSVTLSSYSIGKYPVTVGQYKKFCTATSRDMPEKPSWGWNDKHPMVMVTYDDALSYCNWLRKTYGGDWRLPTEAEWEYAACGGNKSGSFEYSGSNDIDRVGWYAGNAGGQTQSVGRKAPNELGIYDMSGNVWEWCKDWYGDYSAAAQTNPKGAASGSKRVVRGGSWYDFAAACCVAIRFPIEPGFSDNNDGFRVVLSQ